jgi:hypothetical protein
MEGIVGIIAVVWMIMMLMVPIWVWEIKGNLKKIVGKDFDYCDFGPDGVLGHILKELADLKKQNAALLQELALRNVTTPQQIPEKETILPLPPQNLEEEATGYPGPTPDEIAARNKALLIGTITVVVFLVVLVVGVAFLTK